MIANRDVMTIVCGIHGLTVAVEHWDILSLLRHPRPTMPVLSANGDVVTVLRSHEDVMTIVPGHGCIMAVQSRKGYVMSTMMRCGGAVAVLGGHGHIMARGGDVMAGTGITGDVVSVVGCIMLKNDTASAIGGGVASTWGPHLLLM